MYVKYNKPLKGIFQSSVNNTHTTFSVFNVRGRPWSYTETFNELRGTLSMAWRLSHNTTSTIPLSNNQGPPPRVFSQLLLWKPTLKPNCRHLFDMIKWYKTKKEVQKVDTKSYGFVNSSLINSVRESEAVFRLIYI